MRQDTDKKIFVVGEVVYTLVRAKRWYIEYYTPAGVRIRRYNPLNRIKDLADRERKAVELINEIAGGTGTTSALTTMLDKIKPTYKPKTYSNRKSHVKKFAAWLGGKPDHLVSPEQARDFMLHLAAERLKPETIRSVRRSLNTLYDQIDKANNPFKHTPIPKGESKSLLYFQDAQIKKLQPLIAAGNERLWLAVQLLYYCFIRGEEMRFLETSDFNLQAGYIEVRGEISKNKKTQKVSIPAALMPYLQSLPIFRQSGSHLLFQTQYGKYNGPVGKNWFNRMHSEYLKDAGIIGRYAFYSWKHTGAVKAVRAGINIKDLQLQLRHHSLDQVNEYLKDLGVLDSDDLRNKFPAL